MSVARVWACRRRCQDRADIEPLGHRARVGDDSGSGSDRRVQPARRRIRRRCRRDCRRHGLLSSFAVRCLPRSVAVLPFLPFSSCWLLFAMFCRWLLVAVFAVSPLGTGARTVLVLRSRPRPRRRFRFAAHCLLLPLPSPLLFAFRPIPTGISHSHCYHARCYHTTIRGPTGKCGPSPIAVAVAVGVAVTACCRWSVPMREPLSDLAPIAAAVAVTSTVTVTVTFSKSGCYTGSVVTGTVAITVSAALTSIYCHRRHYSCYHP